MTKATRFFTLAIPTALLYLLLLLHFLPTPFLSQSRADELLPYIPFWLLVAFGSYSLVYLGLGILSFRDCPEAYESLLEEITTAKNELRDKGVTVD